MFIAEQFRLFIDHGAIDILHPDVLFCGGMHELRRIADYADLHRLPLAMHGNGGALATIAAAHVAAASRNFLGLEYHFIETPWISQYVRRVGAAAGAPLFEDGHVVLSDAPGLGVELDEQVCRATWAAGSRSSTRTPKAGADSANRAFGRLSDALASGQTVRHLTLDQEIEGSKSFLASHSPKRPDLLEPSASATCAGPDGPSDGAVQPGVHGGPRP